MNTKIKKRILAAAAVLTSLALCACQTTPQVSFDTAKPWHDTGDSYEKLTYSVKVFKSDSGEMDGRNTIIGEGALVFELEENSSNAQNVSYSTIKTDMTVTYNDLAAEKDRGKTDVIKSEVVFMTESLATSTMKKEVIIAPRDDEVNLSYIVTADYMGEHVATRKMTGQNAEEERMEIPSGMYYDNEMMFYLARATNLALSASNNFYMTNIFNSFVSGSFTNYTMLATVSSESQKHDIGEWVQDFGVTKTVADDGSISYPVGCFNTSILISADQHGPAYYASYSEAPFKKDGKEHKKIPVNIHFNQYAGNKLSVYTEYQLNACSFEKE